MEGTQKTSLLDFDFDDEKSFFGTVPVKEEEIIEKKPEKENKPEEEEDITFFNVEKEEEKEKKEFKPLVKSLKDYQEVGLLKNIELGEDEEIDEDRFFELQAEDIETEISTRLKSWADELDEDASNFIKFKLNGGDTQEFFKSLSQENKLPSGNISDESYQDKVIRYQLKKEGWDPEEIEDRLEYWTESGKKESIAKKYDFKVKEEIRKQQDILIKEQEKKDNLAKEQKQTFKTTIKNTLDKVESINGFTITPKEKTDLYNFVTREDFKIGNKNITGFQKKLAEVFADTEKMLLIAKLIKSNFDMSGFETQVQTKYSKKVKDNIEQQKSRRVGSLGSSPQGSSLADFFN